MQGNIFSDEKCPTCGGKFEHFEQRHGLFCPVHGSVPLRSFRVSFGKEIRGKRFGSYQQAARFLTGIRYKHDEGTYDPRDYRAENPLGFATLSAQWLLQKEKSLKPGSFKVVRLTMATALSAWGNKNIKTIRYSEIENLLLAMEISDKTRHNRMSVLRDFFAWVEKRERENGYLAPEMPTIKFDLGMRNIISKTTQQTIIAKVKEIAPFKVWLGIHWLSIYIKMRPVEMLRLTERNVGINGCLVIPPEDAKEGKPKIIPLLPEDVALLQEIPRGFPDMPFFRHGKVKGHRPDSPYHQGYLYKVWKRACKELGVENVDLYGGTRHSTVTALAEYFSRAEIKEHGTGHTSKAFERYMLAESSVSLEIYAKAAEKKEVHSNVITVDFGKR